MPGESLDTAPAVHADDLSQRGISWFGPDPGWRFVDTTELWRFRELLLVFAGRDLKVRYRQAVVGVLWALLQPLGMMAVFAVFFGLLREQPTTSSVPYSLSVFVGLLLWQLISGSIRDATSTLVRHREMLTKIYFPRLVLPLSCVLVALADFAVAALLLIPLGIAMNVELTASVLLFPLVILWAAVLSSACGIWLSGLNALYRDIGHAVPFLLQLGMFLTPVVYETEAIIPERYRLIYSLNPAAAVIEAGRWSLFGAAPPGAMQLTIGLGMTVALLLSGLIWFRRAERTLIDRV